MMAVILERYERPKALWQGYSVLKLVGNEGDWLAIEQPETLRRYRDWLHAIKNVARLATKEGLEAFIVRSRKGATALGLATIISNQTIIHPDGPVIRGNDLDYWLHEYSPDRYHSAVADELVRISNNQSGPRRAVFATVRQGHLNPPIGLMGDMAGEHRYMLSAVGPVANVTTPTGNDPFGVTRNHIPVQVYTLPGATQMGE